MTDWTREIELEIELKKREIADLNRTLSVFGWARIERARHELECLESAKDLVPKAQEAVADL